MSRKERTSDSKASDRGVTIRVRARAAQLEKIDRASIYVGKSRSEFMLDSACREAESVLLDQTSYSLNTSAWRKFKKALDAPPRSNERLRDLMTTKSPWET